MGGLHHVLGGSAPQRGVTARVAFADDSYLVREGVASVLQGTVEVELLARVGDPAGPFAAVALSSLILLAGQRPLAPARALAKIDHRPGGCRCRQSPSCRPSAR